jgi:hypothetical protein
MSSTVSNLIEVLKIKCSKEIIGGKKRIKKTRKTFKKLKKNRKTRRH